ncbi:MAG: DNA polymerase I [Phycisphaerae bacterium]|nr:DNA polymerase I [Phycisphaerae bacterium]
MPKTLYIIDGHAQIYRAYYAPFRDLSSPAGEPTRATYVFCQMLLNLIRDRQPDYLAMVLDADERKLFRRHIYPEYKAQREPPPEDLRPQEERIISILAAAGVPMLRQEGFEADDIIATLVHRLADTDLEVFLVSRDKDLEQLLRERVALYDPMKDEVVTPESLLETKGWRPEQAIEAQILTGDSVDNVPGVPGIGPKTAAKLLKKYGSAQAVIDHADELTPKQRQNVLAFSPRIELTRQLVTLRNDVPIDFDTEQAACERFEWARVRSIFEELGLRRLQEQLPAADAAPGATAVSAVSPDKTLLTEQWHTDSELCEPDGGDYHLVNTPETFEQLVSELAQQSEFALDTETTSVNPIDCDLVGLSFAWTVGRGYYVPVRSVYGNTLPLQLVRERLTPILADPSKRKVGQNLKYDLNVLRNAGMPVAGPLFDTMVAAFLVDPARGSYALDKLVPALLGHRMIPISDLLGKGKQQLQMDQIPVEQVAEYAAEDADYTWRLRQLCEPRLAPLGVERLFYDVEMPLVAVLTDMEAHGISLDVDFLAEIGGQMAQRVAAIADEVHNIVGSEFNLDSPKQLSEVLFDQLKFRVVRRTKTTRSTDADTLEILRRETGQPIFALLLEYREIQKLRGTYVDALPNDRSRRTGRIHTSYHQTGTVTGRLSSSEPNLQNIPVRTEAGRQIRRAFVPRGQDELLIVADYSQIELRVLAHFCEDEALVRAFVEDQDIHAFVAAQVNGVELADVTKEMRGRAKAVNFGIVYGQTAFGLAQTTGMSRTEAQAFIDQYFARYPRIREFIARCLANAKRDGYVRTILGRRRPIEHLTSRNATRRAQAERFAVNTVIQGSAADLIKIAMIRLHERIQAERLPLRMLLQVHDELVCEAPRESAPSMSDTIRAVMTDAMTLRVPLKVDVASGENWLQAK